MGRSKQNRKKKTKDFRCAEDGHFPRCSGKYLFLECPEGRVSSLAPQRSRWNKILLALTLYFLETFRDQNKVVFPQPRRTLMLHQQRALPIPGRAGKPSISPTPGLIERTVFGSWVILLLLRLPPFFQGPLTGTSSGKPSLAAP